MLKKLFLIVALVFSMTAQARQSATTLMDPPPLPIPQGVSAVDVEKAIITSGVTRNWKVIEKKPGSILLEYAPREFSVKVKVSYDAHSVNIVYADSTDMEYGQEKGVAVIHPNYNRWVNNLAHDIEAQMSVATAK
ncbi:MAG: hypothetical protein JWR07_2328 [Nevskia sp.]|nr:hypothetical protein [Nevskia sp.]